MLAGISLVIILQKIQSGEFMVQLYYKEPLLENLLQYSP